MFDILQPEYSQPVVFAIAPAVIMAGMSILGSLMNKKGGEGGGGGMGPLLQSQGGTSISDIARASATPPGGGTSPMQGYEWDPVTGKWVKKISNFQNALSNPLMGQMQQAGAPVSQQIGGLLGLLAAGRKSKAGPVNWSL